MHSPVAALSRTLQALAAILTKAEAHCTAHKIDAAVMLALRLFPDMLPLTRQVQLTCDFCARSVARLSGSDVPSYPDVETTFAELQTRIATAKTYVDGFSPAQFDGSETREITLQMRGAEVKMSGADYCTLYSLPQVYFHATTAYNILRHNGVGIGKRDFMGA